MAAYGFVVPILPGMVERDHQLAAELAGPRHAEYLASRIRHGVVREQVWLQETPQGMMSVVYLEAEDIGKALAGIAASQDPFDVWWREQILAIHGLDLTQPLPGPMNEQIMNLRRG